MENIKHTRSRSFLHSVSRGEFIGDCLYLVCYIREGRANVGLRRPGTLINSRKDVMFLQDSIEEIIALVPQQVLQDDQLEKWRIPQPGLDEYR